MTEQECLNKMIAPGQFRKGKYRGGVIQIHITRACDKECFGCTQGSNLGGNPGMITPEQFEIAVKSLIGYWGVVGVFGGNPAMHPKFEELCDILAKHIPFVQRGLWCNNPITHSKAVAMRRTFNPAVSNLNVHLDTEAYQLFRNYWPESRPFGLDKDSRHSPVYVAMKDVLKKACPKCDGTKICKHTSKVSNFGMEEFKIPEGTTLTIERRCEHCNGTGKIYDEEKAWELISDCDINQHWSAMIGVFRGEVRAWFCEIAGAQSMLHQHDTIPCETCNGTGISGRVGGGPCLICNGKKVLYSYPDTGIPIKYWLPEDNDSYWWQQPMQTFARQVRKHCHDCGVPMRGHGELAQSNNPDSREQVSSTHQSVFKPKDKSRRVELITVAAQLGKPLNLMTDYLGNAEK